MKTEVCQSCGLNFSPEAGGTNRNGSINSNFCRACFSRGEFTEKSLTMHELEVRLLEMAEVHNEITLEEAQGIIKRLPDLKRWRLNNL